MIPRSRWRGYTIVVWIARLLVAALATDADVTTAPTPPITLRLIGAGQGTTATHALYTLVCEMGLKACHYTNCCNVRPSSAVALANNEFIMTYKIMQMCVSNEQSELQTYCGLTPDLLSFNGGDGLPVHCNRAVRKPACCYRFGTDVPEPVLRDMLRQHGCSTEKLLDHLQATLRNLVTSGVEALMDTPTANFLSSFAGVMPHHPFRVVLTRRDPSVWAEKRVDEHGSFDLLCRINNGAGARLGDFEGCMRSALASHRRDGHDDPLRISQTFEQLTDMEAEERAKEMRAFQNTFMPQLVQQLALAKPGNESDSQNHWLIEIDFFEQTIDEKPMERRVKLGDREIDIQELERLFFEEARTAVQTWWTKE
eukprot:scaffold846_cov252-Pinguiococcus_pyrenoidosus.AAC.5